MISDTVLASKPTRISLGDGNFSLEHLALTPTKNGRNLEVC